MLSSFRYFPGLISGLFACVWLEGNLLVVTHLGHGQDGFAAGRVLLEAARVGQVAILEPPGDGGRRVALERDLHLGGGAGVQAQGVLQCALVEARRH